MSTTFNTDKFLHRLRERQTEESHLDTLCDNCGATLTSIDRSAGYCTQCQTPIDDVDDESRDEDLLEVELGDYLWDGYSLND